MVFTDVLALLNGKKVIREICDLLLLHRRTFTGTDLIVVPADKVLQMHSPSIECEVEISGELYIL